MKTLFADAHFFLALQSQKDSAHLRAVQFAQELNCKIVTTEWVLTEVADGLAKPAHRRKAFLAFYQDLRADESTVILGGEHAYFEKGMELYRARPDKEWSLTDCISFVIMQQFGITEALTGDHHFEQAGFVALLK